MKTPNEYDKFIVELYFNEICYYRYINLSFTYLFN